MERLTLESDFKFYFWPAKGGEEKKFRTIWQARLAALREPVAQVRIYQKSVEGIFATVNTGYSTNSNR